MITEINLYKHYKDIKNLMEKAKCMNNSPMGIPGLHSGEIKQLINWFDTLKKGINDEIEFKNNLEAVLDGKKIIKVFSVEKMEYIQIEFDEYYDNIIVNGTLYVMDDINDGLSFLYIKPNDFYEECYISIFKIENTNVIKISCNNETWIWPYPGTGI